MGRLKPAAALLSLVLALGASTPAGQIQGAGPPLRFAGGPADTFDPAFITDAGDVQLLLQLYAGLTRLDETGAPYPSLAEGWSVSDDGLTYTFRLRDGLRFSDGTPLEAGDVRRSWLRLIDPETGASAPDVLSLVAGANERLAGDVDEDEVGIEAPDARTLVVSLRHEASYFPELAATPATFVVPPAADGSPDWQRPDAFVGSGPYVVDGTDGVDLVLRANPEYVAGPPPIDEVRWVADLETDGASAFAAGAVDLVQVAGWDATWIAYDPDLGPRLNRAEALSVGFLAFDTTRPPFDDARIRRALALALDRERLVPLAEGDGAQPAGSIVPPAVWPRPEFGELHSDAAEARRLLDEAGGAAGLGTIVVNGTGLGVAPIVGAWREQLGIEVVVEEMEFDEYLDELERGPPHIYTIGWIADYPSPHALYTLLLLPGALSNYGRWADERFVALLDEAAAASDDAERAEAYAAVDAHVTAEAPIIPWSYDETWWLVADGLRGLGNLTVGLLDLGRVSWDG